MPNTQHSEATPQWQPVTAAGSGRLVIGAAAFHDPLALKREMPEAVAAVRFSNDEHGLTHSQILPLRALPSESPMVLQPVEELAWGVFHVRPAYYDDRDQLAAEWGGRAVGAVGVSVDQAGTFRLAMVKL